MAVQILSQFEAHVQYLKGFERQKLRAQLATECEAIEARERLLIATQQGSAYLTSGIRQMAIENLSNSPEELQEVQAKIAVLDSYL